MAQHRVGRKTMVLREVSPDSEAIDFRFAPLNGKGQRRIQDDIEIVVRVGVLPEVFAIYHQVFAEGLLESCIEFVPLGWNEWPGPESAKDIGRKSALPR